MLQCFGTCTHDLFLLFDHVDFAGRAHWENTETAYITVKPMSHLIDVLIFVSFTALNLIVVSSIDGLI